MPSNDIAHDEWIDICDEIPVVVPAPPPVDPQLVEGAPEAAGWKAVASPGPGSLLDDIRRGIPRSALIAVIVGTILVIVNQGDRLTDVSPGLIARCALTYLTPFVVSMLGWLSASRDRTGT